MISTLQSFDEFDENKHESKEVESKNNNDGDSSDDEVEPSLKIHPDSHNKLLSKPSISSSPNQPNIHITTNTTSHITDDSPRDIEIEEWYNKRNAHLINLQRRKVLSYSENMQLEREVETLRSQLAMLESYENNGSFPTTIPITSTSTSANTSIVDLPKDKIVYSDVSNILSNYRTGTDLREPNDDDILTEENANNNNNTSSSSGSNSKFSPSRASPLHTLHTKKVVARIPRPNRVTTKTTSSITSTASSTGPATSAIIPDSDATSTASPVPPYGATPQASGSSGNSSLGARIKASYVPSNARRRRRDRSIQQDSTTGTANTSDTSYQPSSEGYISEAKSQPTINSDLDSSIAEAKYTNNTSALDNIKNSTYTTSDHHSYAYPSSSSKPTGPSRRPHFHRALNNSNDNTSSGHNSDPSTNCESKSITTTTNAIDRDVKSSFYKTNTNSNSNSNEDVSYIPSTARTSASTLLPSSKPPTTSLELNNAIGNDLDSEVENIIGGGHNSDPSLPLPRSSPRLSRSTTPLKLPQKTTTNNTFDTPTTAYNNNRAEDKIPVYIPSPLMTSSLESKSSKTGPKTPTATAVNTATTPSPASSSKNRPIINSISLDIVTTSNNIQTALELIENTVAYSARILKENNFNSLGKNDLNSLPSARKIGRRPRSRSKVGIGEVGLGSGIGSGIGSGSGEDKMGVLEIGGEGSKVEKEEEDYLESSMDSIDSTGYHSLPVSNKGHNYDSKATQDAPISSGKGKSDKRRPRGIFPALSSQDGEGQNYDDPDWAEESIGSLDLTSDPKSAPSKPDPHPSAKQPSLPHPSNDAKSHNLSPNLTHRHSPTPPPSTRKDHKASNDDHNIAVDVALNSEESVSNISTKNPRLQFLRRKEVSSTSNNNNSEQSLGTPTSITRHNSEAKASAVESSSSSAYPSHPPPYPQPPNMAPSRRRRHLATGSNSNSNSSLPLDHSIISEAGNLSSSALDALAADSQHGETKDSIADTAPDTANQSSSSGHPASSQRSPKESPDMDVISKTVSSPSSPPPIDSPTLHRKLSPSRSLSPTNITRDKTDSRSAAGTTHNNSNITGPARTSQPQAHTAMSVSRSPNRTSFINNKTNMASKASATASSNATAASKINRSRQASPLHDSKVTSPEVPSCKITPTLPLETNVSGKTNDSGSFWTPSLDTRWQEVMFLLKKPIQSEGDMIYTIAAAEAGLMFIDEVGFITILQCYTLYYATIAYMLSVYAICIQCLPYCTYIHLLTYTFSYTPISSFVCYL